MFEKVQAISQYWLSVAEQQKCKNEYSKNEMPCLDLKVGIKNGNITTDLCVRDTDTYQYLHYSSSQPYPTKRSTVFSQPLRLSCLCTF